MLAAKSLFNDFGLLPVGVLLNNFAGGMMNSGGNAMRLLLAPRYQLAAFLVP